ncbi:MAG TPA: sugar MFS transporter [Steroidobacteraceae bacterium]|nr:sugar MFS transporter [Steroidobacteraceae bacterium]
MTEQKKGGLLAAFIAVTTLFFAWGFVTSINDPLVAAVKKIFSLNYAEATLTQFAFFIAYGIVSIPGGALVARVGYGRAIVFALLAMVAGCLFMPVATHADRYGLVLVALFIIASGMTVLQVAANPLSAALGRPEQSHFRLVLSQAFNSLGTVIGPWMGAHIMLRGGLFSEGAVEITPAVRAESLQKIDLAYFILAAVLVVLVVYFWRSRERMANAAPTATGAHSSVLEAFRSRWAVLGAVAIFLYVGAEVSIASLMTNFLNRPDVLDVTLERAGKMTGLYYWGGAMVGRFAGSWLLTKVSAPRLLTIFAIVAAILCFTVTQGSGTVAGYAALAVGLFNSIMFPVIFTVTLERSTASTAATSSLLCMAIIGGAILPYIVGRSVDSVGLNTAFFIPLAAYIAIAFVAFSSARAPVVSVTRAATGTSH